MAEQSFQSHAKRLPSFHFFVLPVLLINFGFQIYWCVRAAFTIYGVLSVLVAAASSVGRGMARAFAVKVQEAVILIYERIGIDAGSSADHDAARRGLSGRADEPLRRCA